ncbi:hypothetical protein ACIRD3_34565 [Kitasatospora sp. NPDC093550]|uniref:hypothetical protein n=1 Tax=Kitasatospora sp. NPDC093550 TaxID=3364089 RepID=UPI00382254C2
MGKGILGRIGRRGAAAAATVALAAGAVGLSAGDASAWAWYDISYHPSGHGVGVYANPNSGTRATGIVLWSVSGSHDEIGIDCWTRGEDINNQGNVWYRVQGVAPGNGGVWWGQAYVYGAYADSYWYFHNVWQNGNTGECR